MQFSIQPVKKKSGQLAKFPQVIPDRFSFDETPHMPQLQQHGIGEKGCLRNADGSRSLMMSTPRHLLFYESASG